ncbi:MAG: VOC family protein [Magnetospiraceae bacterium]
MIGGLDHVAINTEKPEATKRFYCEILGLETLPRPDFGIHGYWLGRSENGQMAPFIHLVSHADQRSDYSETRRTVDHVALKTKGFTAICACLDRAGLPWYGSIIDSIGIWQIKVYDPNGVLLELNFDAAQEQEPTPEIPLQNRRRSGGGFFDASAYEAFGAA